MPEPKPLTESQQRALDVAGLKGAVIPGHCGNGRGGHFRVHSSAILALISRGLLVRCFSPDGGLMGHITDAGFAALAKARGR